MRLAFCLCPLMFAGFAAIAQENSLSLEINALDQLEQGCQLTFVANTNIAGGIEKAVFETVLFNTEGQVSLLTLFDFRDIPVNRPRVRQFVLPAKQCDDIGTILINGIQTCTVANADTSVCNKALSVTSRTNVEFKG